MRNDARDLWLKQMQDKRAKKLENEIKRETGGEPRAVRRYKQKYVIPM